MLYSARVFCLLSIFVCKVHSSEQTRATVDKLTFYASAAVIRPCTATIWHPKESPHSPKYHLVSARKCTHINCSATLVFIPIFIKGEAILENIYINKPAVEKAAKFYGSCYSDLDAVSRAKWALTLVHLLDYTTLSADNTECSIRHHCTRAAYPIGKLLHDPMVAELAGEQRIVTGAVCVYPSHVRTAAKVLGHLDEDRDIEIATGNAVCILSNSTDIFLIPFTFGFVHSCGRFPVWPISAEHATRRDPAGHQGWRHRDRHCC